MTTPTNQHISLARLRASDIPSPFAPDAREVRVTRERDAEGFMVAKGHDSKGGFYYTVRNATAWRGYKIENNIAGVRRLIGRTA